MKQKQIWINKNYFKNKKKVNKKNNRLGVDK